MSHCLLSLVPSPATCGGGSTPGDAAKKTGSVPPVLSLGPHASPPRDRPPAVLTVAGKCGQAVWGLLPPPALRCRIEALSRAQEVKDQEGPVAFSPVCSWGRDPGPGGANREKKRAVGCPSV